MEKIPYHAENSFDFPRLSNLAGVIAHYPAVAITKAYDTQAFAHKKPSLISGLSLTEAAERKLSGFINDNTIGENQESFLVWNSTS